MGLVGMPEFNTISTADSAAEGGSKAAEALIASG